MSEHLCNTCKDLYPECRGNIIKWGIDADPTARGAEADKVLKCDGYAPMSRNVGVGSPGENPEDIEEWYENEGNDRPY